MSRFSKIVIAVSVTALLIVVCVCVFSGSIVLPAVSKRVESIAISQTGLPQVSVYSEESGVTYMIENHIDNEETTAFHNGNGEAGSETSASTTVPVFYVTEYAGEKTEEDRTIVADASDTYVKPIGRTEYDGSVRWFSMSGSGVEFDCEGKSADIQLIHEKAQSTVTSHQPRAAVFVNGYLVFDQTLQNRETHVSIDLTSCGGRAIVRIIKLSESAFSYFGVGNITVVGKRPIVPTAQKQLKIEFIGDSITCGFGIDEPDNNKRFSTATENFSKTYAYLTAAALDADYSAVCYSGYGVYSGFSHGTRNTSDVIFSRYENAVDNKSFESDGLPSQWDFTRYSPNLVVINLGTNDASYCRSETSRAGFVEEYKRLLYLVREKNPDAYILCVLGDMNNSMFPYIEQAVSEYRAETGETKVKSEAIAFDMGNTDIVISGHPGAQANRRASETLIPIIQSLIQSGQIY